MKAYNISFDPSLVSTPVLIQFLDSKAEILNWYTPFTGTVLIVSNSNPRELASLISSVYPYYNFLIGEVNSSNADGRLPQAAWDFINNPKSSGKWDYYSTLYGALYPAKNLTNYNYLSPSYGLTTNDYSSTYQNPLTSIPHTSVQSIADMLYGPKNQKK